MKLSMLLLAWAALLSTSTSYAQNAAYPRRAIRIVTPFPAASVTDLIARPIAQHLSEAWQQNVIVDNRAGAGGNTGADIVAKSTPDGYTLLLGANAPNAVNASLYKKMPYDVLKDFAPIALLVTGYQILAVHPSVPAKSVKELIALASAQPGKLSYASAGSGTTPHLASELFKTMAGVSMVHVPYKGAQQAMTDLLAGRVEMYFAPGSAALPFADKLRFLGTSGAKREAALPDVPTISEAGLTGFEATAWFGLLAPAGTPADIVAKLHSEVTRIVALPQIRQFYANSGLAVTTSTPSQFSAFIKREVEKWAAVVKASGAHVD